MIKLAVHKPPLGFEGASDNVHNFVADLKKVNAVICLTHELVLYIQKLHAVLFVDNKKDIN